jgi:8-oxo-dGTP diphosphatase
MRRYVAGFMFSADGSEVLLVEKQKPAWQCGLLNGIGGKIESGETSIQSLIREFAEETGIETTPADWTAMVHYVREKVYEVYFYKAFTDKIVIATSREGETVAKFAVDNLPENVIFNLKWLIPLCLDQNINTTYPISVFEDEQSPIRD